MVTMEQIDALRRESAAAKSMAENMELLSWQRANWKHKFNCVVEETMKLLTQYHKERDMVAHNAVKLYEEAFCQKT